MCVCAHFEFDEAGPPPADACADAALTSRATAEPEESLAHQRRVTAEAHYFGG